MARFRAVSVSGIEKNEGPGRTERKRLAILLEAEALFLDRGFDGTSVDEVAARAEVSKQTVYKQFYSKERLFVAVVKAMTTPPADRVQAELGDPKTAAGVKETLTEYGARLLSIALMPKLMRIRRLAIAETDRFPELGRALYENGPGRAIAGLAGALDRWSGHGFLVVADPVIAATQFNWLVMGDPVNRAMFFGDVAISPKQQKRHLEESVSVFLAAYKPRGQPEKDPPGAIHPGKKRAKSIS